MLPSLKKGQERVDWAVASLVPLQLSKHQQFSLPVALSNLKNAMTWHEVDVCSKWILRFVTHTEYWQPFTKAESTYQILTSDFIIFVEANM